MSVSEKFWVIIFALSLINFGVLLVLAGSGGLDRNQFLTETGSWMALAGVAILAYLVMSRVRNGSNNK